jgi:hypothetical protein
MDESGGHDKGNRAKGFGKHGVEGYATLQAASMMNRYNQVVNESQSSGAIAMSSCCASHVKSANNRKFSTLLWDREIQNPECGTVHARVKTPHLYA